jgi:large subunit ribosomal protein L19
MDAIRQLEQKYLKPSLPVIQSGDTVRVHQLIREGNKQRIQVFEGVVIRRHRLNEVTACITVRRIASGVGVEKTFLLHSPNVSKIEVIRRAKVRRNFLSYLRDRRGKSARLQELAFDKSAVNVAEVKPTEAAADAAVTEIDPVESSDALDDAVSIDAEVKAENKAAAGEDTVVDADGTDTQAEQVEEVESGVVKAEPGEGEAVSS